VRKVTLLLPQEDFERFDSYCHKRGFKKSPLVVRLVRDYLDQESFFVQGQLNLASTADGTRLGTERRG